MVFPLETYADLVDMMKRDSFALPNALGKLSNDREEAAALLIRIFHKYNMSIEFIKTIIEQEVGAAKDAQTLFRSNSMASKALDMYMKFVAGDYLRSTLEGVLKVIVLNKKSCEMDPTRLKDVEDDKGKADNTPVETRQAVHAQTLMDYAQVVLDAIFKSADQLPS